MEVQDSSILVAFDSQSQHDGRVAYCKAEAVSINQSPPLSLYPYSNSRPEESLTKYITLTTVVRKRRIAGRGSDGCHQGNIQSDVIPSSYCTIFEWPSHPTNGVLRKNAASYRPLALFCRPTSPLTSRHQPRPRQLLTWPSTPMRRAALQVSIHLVLHIQTRPPLRPLRLPLVVAPDQH
jgi:hypothetical protein